jgi:hypothetical protein
LEGVGDFLMRRLLYLIAVLALVPICGGCLATPNFVHPGTEEYQQARARVFEPYPENEPGPPIVGGRPREYQNPVAEVNRVTPRPGEAILWPYGQAAPQQAPAQPAIVTAPPQIYLPPCPAQPVSP